jgi:hypothetical protein
MTDGKKPAEPKTVGGGTATPVMNITRRRFTKAGAVAPMLMTLASRPVWGQACSFSGQLSGNDYATAPPPGSGLMPSEWQLNTYKEYLPVGIDNCKKNSGDSAGQGTTQDTKTNNSTGTNADGGKTESSDTGDNNNILNDLVVCHLGTNLDKLISEDMTFKEALEAGDDTLTGQIAAAVLNIRAFNYGYQMHGLIGFLESAAAHPDEALAVLQCLNGRGVRL